MVFVNYARSNPDPLSANSHIPIPVWMELEKWVGLRIGLGDERSLCVAFFCSHLLELNICKLGFRIYVVGPQWGQL